MSRASARSLPLPMGARPGELGGGRNEKGGEKEIPDKWLDLKLNY